MTSTLTTPLCDRLGITHPIIMAPISAAPNLIAAVSNAGGLGMIQATWHSPDELLDTISEVRRLTDRPFGANFVLPLIEEQDYANLDAALEANVPVISTFWGDPASVIDRLRGAGTFSLHTVASAREALSAVDVGVNAVVAQGVEAGGHIWGHVGTIALTPTVVDAVPHSHVIAAGGIVDGRGLAAVLALGAEAAWIGTRFLLATEFDGLEVYRRAIIEANETDTIYSSLFDIGWPDAPHRALVNDTVETWIAAGRPEPGHRPNEGEIVGYYDTGDPIYRYSTASPQEGMTGNLASACLYAGQGVGLVNAVKPAAEIIDEIITDALRVLSGFPRVQ